MELAQSPEALSAGLGIRLQQTRHELFFCLSVQVAQQGALSTGEESDVEELQEEVASLESQMKEVLSKYSNVEERLDVVERQLLDMARDALVATHESEQESGGESDTDNEDEQEAHQSSKSSSPGEGSNDSSSSGSRVASAAGRPGSLEHTHDGTVDKSSGKGRAMGPKWEERKQELVERQLQYQQAAEQATSATEKAGLMGMVASVGKALKKLGPTPAEPPMHTKDGHIQLPPAGSGFNTLETEDFEGVLAAVDTGTPQQPDEGNSNSAHAARDSESSGSSSSSGGGGNNLGSGSKAANSAEGRAADSNDAASNGRVSVEGDAEGQRELRIAQARRGDQSAVQAKQQAGQQKRDEELAKEEAEEEQRRREVEQGGSMATTIPLQAAQLPPPQGAAEEDGTSQAPAAANHHVAPSGEGVAQGGQQDTNQLPGAAGQGMNIEQGEAVNEGQHGSSSESMAFEGQQGHGESGQQQQGGGGAGASEGQQQGSTAGEGEAAQPFKGHQFKSPWWSKARDEEVEELLVQRRGASGDRESEEEKEERQKKEQEEKEKEERKDNPGILSRSHVYEINRLQSAITEIANSGYIESVKQLRETLLIQEWDMSNRHLAKKRAISMFERHLVEFNLYEEAGGFEVIGALYEDPDAYVELLVSERLRGLARSMMEECMSERRMQVYQSCNATAKDIAMRELNSSGLTSIFSMKEGLWGVAQRLFSIVQRIVMPFKFW
ncbi:hypothetical protein DUNSADRAFT_3365 [Dunaliella salina]|uniref:Uncharacterized protein n=1 Tax=Dunaliella salina TaxID=3046 RepID=A0ABQ7GUD7_DUNSA|nr:hypothetical protein DUNSADRAFT_3365 [Dunaliella salina]|eukprot:KAF5838115.1 hypothetical protein DUNSADRAFT_3365 [Dunaliella salina]